MTVEELMGWHEKRFVVLCHAKPDLIIFETIPCVQEAKAIAALIHKYSKGVPVSLDEKAEIHPEDKFTPLPPLLISFSCRSERQLCSGEDICLAVEALEDVPSIVGVGINCTSPKLASQLLTSIREVTSKPLVAYCNKGLHTWDEASGSWKFAAKGGKVSDAEFASAASDWYRLGARFVGGCCHTTPEPLRHLVSVWRIISEGRG